VFTAWERWDALWFLRIADGGYAVGDGSAAFFPLYPLLVRGVSAAIGGHPLAAGLIVSNAFFLVATLVVYRLTEEEWDDTIARRTVLFLSIFPTAFFFLAPYSESLFLALSAGCFLAARRGRWGWAAVLGALGAATRSMGVLLIIPLLLQALAWWRALPDGERRPQRLVFPTLASLFVGAGTFSYLMFWHISEGEFWAPLSSQNGWAREFSWFWQTLWGGTQQALEFVGVYSGGYHQLDWIVVVLALCAAAWVVKKTRAPYAAYTLAALVMPMTLIFGGRPFMSMPRFVLPLFPLFWALAHLSVRYRVNDLIVAVSAAGLGVMTLLFVNWYYVF
jgi:hypothetical protein